MVTYPYGTAEAATPQAAEIAEKVGYKLGFSAIKGTNSEGEHPFLLYRFDCNDVVGGKNYNK